VLRGEGAAAPLKVHEYVNASDRAQFRIASENTNKEDVLKEILKGTATNRARHRQYLSQSGGYRHGSNAPS
jgi:ABC-type cobalamin/Fe3+-siderophores transport system ATPase subunit